MDDMRNRRTVSSALWAAYGDVLGFPTELVDASGVHRRLGKPASTHPQSWKRLVGGRNGAWIELPAGSYSDDTQLRLSTCRAIRADGYFDVEAFAKVELPVWLSYSLGAGRGSKLGASTLSQRSVNWFSNFFEQGDISYINGGGNGAAMRIQPHVWAAHDLGNPATYLPEVIQNSLCTHGHPRGIAGAVIYAVCLAHVLRHAEIPPPNDWPMLGSFATLATSYIEESPDLSTFWLPTWNSRSGKQFAEEMELARIEWERDALVCSKLLTIGSPESYRTALSELGGFSPDQRGSGLKSALFSLAAAWLFQSMNVKDALVQVVNVLGSDTDTIGTMAGALLGALHPQFLPTERIQDSAYISSEAQRLFDVSQEKKGKSFSYPDLLTWQPPRNQLDAVGVIDSKLVVSGLGNADAISEPYIASRSEAAWQWLSLPFGQTVLCKRRLSLPSHAKKEEYVGYEIVLEGAAPLSEKSHIEKKSLASKNNPVHLVEKREVSLMQGKLIAPHSTVDATPKRGKSEEAEIDEIDQLSDVAIKNGFDPVEIGRHILKLSDQKDGIYKAAAYGGIIAKARAVRNKRKI